MGQLFTRMATVWFDQQTSSIMTQNSFATLKPIITKRKRIDQDNLSNKRKIVIKSTKDNYDDRLSLSPRISPIIPKNTKSSNIFNRSLSPMLLFKCQLCRRCLTNKDNYLNHMVICAIKCQASIKIVRAEKDNIDS